MIEGIRKGDDPHLYSSLAPVYEFINDRHFDYEAQFSSVQEAIPEGTTSVLEVGCGTGRLLASLEHEYDHVVGLDLHEEMVAIAKEAVSSSTVFAADMKTIDLQARFDAIVMVGRVFPHVLTDAEEIELLRNCYNHLQPGGVIVLDTFDVRGLEDGHSRERTFSSSDFRVTRTSESWITDFEAGRWEFIAEYAITDRKTGETVVTEETMQLRFHTPSKLESYFNAVGFEEISFSRESDFWLCAVASKPF